MPFTQAGASTLFCVNNCRELKILFLECPSKDNSFHTKFRKSLSSGPKAEI